MTENMTPAEYENQIEALRQEITALKKFRDEHKKVEQRLRETLALPEITLSNISDAVFITDDTGCFTFICPNVDTIFGFSKQEVSEFGKIEHLIGTNVFRRSELEKTGEIANIEREVVDVSGKLHSLLINVKKVSIQGGTTLYTCRDVTERKAAEDNLKQSHQFLQATMDALDSEILILNRQGTIVSSNKAWKEFCRSHKLLNGKYGEEGTYVEAFHSEHEEFRETAGRVQSVIENLIIGNKESAEIEVQLPAKPSQQWYLVNVTLFTLNKELNIVVSHLNITPRKLAEMKLQQYQRHLEEVVEIRTKELKETNARLRHEVKIRKQLEEASRLNEERLALITDNAPGIIMQLDMEGTILFANAGFIVSRGTLIDKTIFSLGDEQFKATVEQAVEQLHTLRRTVDFELSLTDEQKLYACKIAPVTDNGVFNSMILICSDITENKIASQRATETHQKMQQIISTITDAIWSAEVDSAGNVTLDFLSPRIEQISGRTPEEYIDSATPWKTLLLPDELDNWYFILKQFTRREINNASLEQRIVTKDKTTRWVRNNIAASESSDGNLRLDGVISNITTKKISEEQTQLALDEANKLNELRSRLVSMISHELRTPLYTISSSSDIIEKYADKLTGEEISEQFKIIHNSVDFLIELLNDVITINTADAGRLQVKPEELELNRFCRDVIDETRLSLDTAPEIRLTLPADETVIITDGKMLRQILYNLVLNSCKYSEPDKPVQVTLSSTKNGVKFTVKDKGIGIDPEITDHIFQPFIRGKNTGNTPGTGLGLAVVKRAVDLINGKISFRSVPDAGTTFTVHLPDKLEDTGDEL